MKKSLSGVFIILLLFLLTACRPEPVEPPYGVWKSENPYVILYINENQYIFHQSGTAWRHLGIYNKFGEELKVFPRFPVGNSFDIVYNLGLRGVGLSSTTLASGSWRMVNDQLHFNLTRQFQEHLGIRRIVFNRIADYDPNIEPEDWITPEIETLLEDTDRRVREHQDRIAGAVWRSESPDITLFLNEEQYILQQLGSTWRHLGIYNKNGEELKVFPKFSLLSQLSIHYNLGLAPRGRLETTTLISGSWSLVDDQIRFWIDQDFREQFGVNVIYFSKVDDYNSIDPVDWITPEIEIFMEDRARRSREREERRVNQNSGTHSD